MVFLHILENWNRLRTVQIYLFNVVAWDNFSSLWIEPGYAFINVLIKQFTSDPVVGIVIIKTIVMALIFKTIYDFSDRINVGLSILAY